MAIFEGTLIWLWLSFALFLFIIIKAGKDSFLGMLDSRIDEIKTEIETAENLRVEAQELLAQYQRKQRDEAKEAESIIETAKKHAEEIKKQTEKEIKETAKRREQQLQERLQRIEENAKQEIRSYASELAVKATTEIIAEKMDEAANTKLVDQSIKSIAGQLN